MSTRSETRASGVVNPEARVRPRVTRGAATLAVLFVLLVITAWVGRVHEDLIDFDVDYRAGQRLLRGEDLAQPDDGHFVYKYLPGAAILELPFALLPRPAARFVFYLVTVGAMLAALWLSYRLLPDHPAKSPGLIGLTFLVLAKYLFREIDLGNINLIITVLLLAMISLLRRPDDGQAPGRELIAGVLWGAATTLKPYGLAFLPYLLVTRRWRAVGAGLGFLGLALLAPSLFFGWSGNIEQHRNFIEILVSSTPHGILNGDNTSLIGFFTSWAGPGALAWTLAGVVFAALAVTVLLVVLAGFRVPDAVVLDGALLLALIPLVEPLGWDYLNLMSMLAIMLLIQQRAMFSPRWRWLLIGNLVVVGVTISAVIEDPLYATYEALVLTTINFLIVIGFTAALRFKRVC